MNEESINNIDQLNEGIDWFKLVYGEAKLEIAKRIKASPTNVLLTLSKDTSSSSQAAQKLQRELSKKELLYRTANDNINPEGDPRYTNKYNGYGNNLQKTKFQEDVNLKFDSLDEADEFFSNDSDNNVIQTISTKRNLKLLEMITGSKYKYTMERFLAKKDNDFMNNKIIKINEAFNNFTKTLIK